MPDIFYILGGFALIIGIIMFRKKGGISSLKKKTGWLIGPEIKGQNHSVGMPERPTLQGNGWVIDFPTVGTKHVHYVQNFNPPSLKGAKEIVMTYKVTGSNFCTKDFGSNRTATVGIQFQRKGDDWSASGKYESYRWYSKVLPELKEGMFTLTVPLEVSSWVNVYGKSTDLSGFQGAINDLENIAVVFGHRSGAGHGVYATEPSTFTLVSLQVLR